MWRLSLSCVPALPGFFSFLFGLSLALFCSSYINIRSKRQSFCLI
jgi:hypothetical protein